MAKFDELNNLLSKTSFKSGDEGEYASPLEPPKEEEEEDIILDLLIMAYMFGNQDGRHDIGVKFSQLNLEDLEKAIYTPIGGKTWKDRLKEASSPADKERIAVTESIRVYNNGVQDAGLTNGGRDVDGNPIYKTWVTKKDKKVRDSHGYLEGVTIPLGSEFYTYNGHHAPYPHGFKIPEEDINCRCIIKLGKTKIATGDNQEKQNKGEK